MTAETEAFLADGYCVLSAAVFGPQLAAAQASAWARVPERPDEPATPARESVLFEDGPGPAAFTGRVGDALAVLLGAGAWVVADGIGYTQFRFPQPAALPWDAATADWHVDPPYAISTDYRHDLRSRDQAVVAQFFWSTIGPGECSILVRPGSHRAAARALAAAGGSLANEELSRATAAATAAVPAREVYGAAGDVILMHGLLLHCGGPHCGTRPRVVSTAMIGLREPPRIDGPDLTPFERCLLG